MKFSNFNIVRGFCGLALAIAMIPNAQAGVVNGGGGKGVVCRNAQQEVVSVEVLDLWEGRTLRGQTPIAATDLPAAVDAALQNLSKSVNMLIFGKDCKHEECLLRDMRESASTFLSGGEGIVRLRGVKLEATGDSFELVSPQHCQVEQIVNYQPGDAPALINQDLFEKMDATNQAALVAHEAYYQLLRKYSGEATSIRTRRAVSFVFSGGIFAPSSHSGDGEKRATHVECSALPRNSDRGHTLGSYLAVYEKSGATYLGLLFGSTPIGTPTFHKEIPEKILPHMFTGTCDRDMPLTNVWHSTGPVEYGRVTVLTSECVGGREKITLQTQAPGSSTFQTEEVTCKWVRE